MLKTILAKTSRFFLVWFLIGFLLIIAWLGGYDLNNRAVAMATITCGALAVWFWISGRVFVEFLYCRTWPAIIKVLLVGLTGAIGIELTFWLWEKIVGAMGVAFNSSFLVTLILTLPSYFLLIILFWLGQKRYRYKTAEILVWGGVYQVVADILTGPLSSNSLLWGIIYGLIGLPIFIIVYSVMMLPLAMLLKKIRPMASVRGSRYQRLVWGLLPMLGFVPFLILRFII